MNSPTFDEFDGYITGLFAPEDEVLQNARARMKSGDLPAINVSASQGKTLQILTRLCGAKRVLEIGTLGGYSAIWIARGLPDDGTVLTLEIDPHHAEIARQNLAEAGLQSRVEVRVGDAAQTLQELQNEGVAPFDLIFIDADKGGYPRYLELSLPLLKSGGLLLADNTLSSQLLRGEADAGIGIYNQNVAASGELDSVILPVLRGFGVGGLLVSIKS